MKFLWRENVFGWEMTGILGKNSRWFLGFSRVPKNAIMQDDSENVR